jgi:hypothetical protein
MAESKSRTDRQPMNFFQPHNERFDLNALPVMGAPNCHNGTPGKLAKPRHEPFGHSAGPLTRRVLNLLRHPSTNPSARPLNQPLRFVAPSLRPRESIAGLSRPSSGVNPNPTQSSRSVPPILPTLPSQPCCRTVADFLVDPRTICETNSTNLLAESDGPSRRGPSANLRAVLDHRSSHGAQIQCPVRYKTLSLPVRLSKFGIFGTHIVMTGGARIRRDRCNQRRAGPMTVVVWPFMAQEKPESEGGTAPWPAPLIPTSLELPFSNPKLTRIAFDFRTVWNVPNPTKTGQWAHSA